MNDSEFRKDVGVEKGTGTIPRRVAVLWLIRSLCRRGSEVELSTK